MKKNENQTSEEKVISAAMSEFALHGYAGARVDSIAEKAGINKAMIYYHFKSKEILYEKILKNITDDIYNQVREAAVEDGEPVDVLYSIISRYMTMLDSFDTRIFQIMLRELASGGKHFKKIAIPNLVVPVFSIIGPLFKSGMDQGKIIEINPYYTFMQIIGGVILLNMMKLPIQGSDFEKLIFKKGYIDEYRENLFKILKNGLELKDGSL